MMKILFSDDNTRLFDDFKDQAFKLNIELVCVTNWEDAQLILEKNWDDYSGLILDGKGQLTADSKSNDSTHVTKATNWLSQQFALGNIIPTIVYTAFLDKESGNIDDFVERKNQILLGMFSKDVPIKEIFQKLIDEYSQLPKNRIKHKFQDIFKLFDDKRLPRQMEQTMIDILTSLGRTSIDKTDYNKIRDIIEAMLKVANGIDKAFVPDLLINQTQGGRPNLGLSEFYLTGRDVKQGQNIVIPKTTPVMQDHIARIYSSIVNCSQIFSHNITQTHYHYSYKATVFGLLEILMWYRDYLTTKYKI